MFLGYCVTRCSQSQSISIFECIESVSGIVLYPGSASQSFSPAPLPILTWTALVSVTILSSQSTTKSLFIELNRATVTYYSYNIGTAVSNYRIVARPQSHGWAFRSTLDTRSVTIDYWIHDNNHHQPPSILIYLASLLYQCPPTNCHLALVHWYQLDFWCKWYAEFSTYPLMWPNCSVCVLQWVVVAYWTSELAVASYPRF